MKNSDTTPDNLHADFCIEIDFQKGTESPSRVFRTMTELIETFQDLDASLIQSIDAKIEPVLIIEDIEAGSIKTWLAYKLRTVPDDAIRELNWKPVVGQYLVNAKYRMIKFLENKTEITSKNQIEELEMDLLKSAEKTKVLQIPAYTPIKHQQLLPNIERLIAALSHLDEDEKAIYITDEDKTQMNARFNFVPEKIEDLLTKEEIRSETEMILKVKKPDYPGESQWEFRHQAHSILAKIFDVEWLKRFQGREYDVRPGDSLRVKTEQTVKYDYDGEVVGIHYKILEVKETIRVSKENQLGLLSPEDKIPDQ